MQRARKLRHRLRRAYHRLPVDGRGALPEGSTDLGRLKNRVASIKWRRVAWWLRPPAVMAARLAWIAACPFHAMAAVRGTPDAPPGTWAALVRLGWSTGKDPVAALMHRRIAGEHRAVADACLDGPQGLRIWSVLADPADRALANDKLATAERMAALGVPAPPTLSIIAAGSTPDVARAPWTDGRALFVKPRNGMGGQHTMMVQPLGNGAFRINGDRTLPAEALRVGLARAAQRQDLLVQPFYRCCDRDADLSPHAPLSLRINVVRAPDGAPAVLSSILRIQPPGRYAVNGAGGAVLAPFEIEGDRLLDGLLFVPAFSRCAAVPWNGAPVTGRRIPELGQAQALALRAAEVFPGIPVIGFDLLLTADGPMLLEANWGLAWYGLHLTHLLTGRASDLPALLGAWIDRVEEPPLTPQAAPA